MKINEKIEGRRIMGIPPKILRIMKLTMLIMTVFLIQVSALTKAQINLNETKAPLQKVLKAISKQSGYSLIYSTEDLKDAIPVNIKLNNATLEKALQLCFAGQPLVYEVSDQTVMIRKKEEPGFLEHIIARFQSIDVRGKVVDQNGSPLAGATVKVKGTTVITTSDLRGEFYLKGTQDGTILEISYIGFTTIEISAKADLGNIKMNDVNAKLDEVQVIAYGTTSRRFSTSNIGTVKGEEIAKQPVSNPILALEGQVPGLIITPANGIPGGGIAVQIQGQNSIFKGNDPFYVIDGIPYDAQLPTNLGGILGINGINGQATGNPFSFISSSDIESISVLKDADAVAIYGSRAANGAILITTKKGRRGDINVNFDLQQGFSKVAHKEDLLNTQQYLEMRNEALKNDGISTPSASDYDLNGFWDKNSYTDWQKEFIGGTNRYTNFTGNISGGSEQVQYYFGGKFHREGSLFNGNFSDRSGSGNFKLTANSVNKKLSFQLTSSFTSDDNQLPIGDLTQYANLAPNLPAPYNTDGSLNFAPDANGFSTFPNPLIGFLNRYKRLSNNLITGASIGYKFTSNLSFQGNVGYTLLNMNELNTAPISASLPEERQFAVNDATFGQNTRKSWLAEPQITYKQAFKDHQVTFLIGGSMQGSTTDVSQIYASGQSSEAQIENIAAASSLTAGYSEKSEYKYLGIFGRIGYDYKHKYLLNITARRDGSSRFGINNKFHSFGAIGAAWIFSEESFLKDKSAILSFGKLRLSYGVSGSDQVGEYSYLTLYSPRSAGIPYQGLTTLYPKTLTNPDLQWEETKKANIGLELGFFKDRILFNADYFRNNSSNQVIPSSLPRITGIGNVIQNFPADVINTGLELSLQSNIVKKKNFSWSTTLNMTIPRNKLGSFSNLASSTYSNLVIGKPLAIVKAYHFLGVDPQTGVYQFLDKDGNATSTPTDADKTELVDISPKILAGLSNTFSYKGFDLSFFFQYVKHLGPTGYYGSNPGSMYFNQPVTVLNRWQKPGDIAPIQRYNSDFSLMESVSDVQQSDAYYKDASFVRLKNLSVSWRFPDKKISKLGIKSLAISIRGENLLTVTKYVGMDPETLSLYSLPLLKTITGGVQIGL